MNAWALPRDIPQTTWIADNVAIKSSIAVALNIQVQIQIDSAKMELPGFENAADFRGL
jgi:hypothetical protein